MRYKPTVQEKALGLALVILAIVIVLFGAALNNIPLLFILILLAVLIAIIGLGLIKGFISESIGS